MRNKIAFLCCLFINPLLLIAQLPSGSIAAYPLDNSTTDFGSSGYTLTLTSTSGDINRFGSGNSATAFIAGTSSGTMPSGLETAISNNFTFGYWFKTTMNAPSSSQWYGGVGLVDAEVCGVTTDWGTALIDGGKIGLGIGNPDVTIKSAGSYNDGIWHFVTVTRDMTTGAIALYVDGSQVATSSGTNTTALTAPPLIGLGRNACVASGLYTGSLDDMIVYNRVLSAPEVTSLYNYYTAVPLPLHWVSFTGRVEEGLVHLEWQTENSVNNDHFEIERSTNGVDFSVIGVLADQDGINSPGGSSLYDFRDKNPSKGNDYYRIRQVDKDGKYSWSSILALSTERVSSGMRLQSNPVIGNATLVNEDQIPIQRLQVIDISGKILIDQAPSTWNSLLPINTMGIRAGHYWLSIFTQANKKTIGFIKL
jgi:hypothetical protein